MKKMKFFPVMIAVLVAMVVSTPVAQGSITTSAEAALALKDAGGDARAIYYTVMNILMTDGGDELLATALNQSVEQSELLSQVGATLSVIGEKETFSGQVKKVLSLISSNASKELSVPANHKFLNKLKQIDQEASEASKYNGQ